MRGTLAMKRGHRNLWYQSLMIVGMTYDESAFFLPEDPLISYLIIISLMIKVLTCSSDERSG